MASRNGLWICALDAAACESGSFEALSSRDGGDTERDAGAFEATRDAGFRDGGAPSADAGRPDAGERVRDGGITCGHRVASGTLTEIPSPFADNFVELAATESEFALAYFDHAPDGVALVPISHVQRVPLRGPATVEASSAGIFTLHDAPIHRVVETSTAWPVRSAYVTLASASIVDEDYLEVGAVDRVPTTTTSILYSGGPAAIDAQGWPRIGLADVHGDRLFYPVLEHNRTLLVTTRLGTATSTTVVVAGANADLPAVVTDTTGLWVTFVDRGGASDDVVIQRVDPATGAPDGFEVRETICDDIVSYEVAVDGYLVAITADCADETFVRFVRQDGRPMGTFTLGETSVRTRLAVGDDLVVGEVAVLHWESNAPAPTVRFFQVGNTTDGGGAMIQSAPAVSLPVGERELPITLALAAGNEPPPRSRTRWAAAYASKVGETSKVRLLRFDGCELP